MFNIHGPFFHYEGMTVGVDSADAKQCWFFPNTPHLATDDQGRPAIRFIVFKEDLDEVGPDEEHAVGLLVFDTSLGWPQQTIDKVARRIADDLDLDEPPRMAPLPYRSGTVRLMFLDAATKPPDDDEPGPGDGDPDPGTPQEPSRWVTVLESSNVPALYGENRAIFSAMLTKRAATLLFGAFEGFIPAGVVYDLSFAGMQRAFNVHVEADWEQVYHHLAERFSMDFVLAQIDLEKVLDELEEKKAINIIATLEGVGEEAMEAEFNAVRKQLQEFMLETFFKPAPNPDTPKGKSEVDGLIDSARLLRNIGGAWPDASYSRVELDISEIRKLDIDYTVARAVERRIAPQAHLSIFFEENGLTRDQVVTVVNGEDALWEEVDFEVAVNADFEGDGINSVTADVRYGPEPAPGSSELVPSWSFRFDRDVTRAARSAWFDPEAGRAARYRYTTHFSPQALPGPQLSIDSGWREHDGQVLVLSPQELYARREVEVQLASGFPSERYPQVHAHLRYEDTGADGRKGWTVEDAALLDAGNPRLPFAFRARRDGPAGVDYRLTYLRPGAEPVQTAWQTTTGDLVLVDDPLPDKLNVRLVVAGDRSQIANLIVDLRYEDPDENVFESQSIVIDQQNVNAVHQWSVPLADPSKRRYEYSQTLIDTQGNLLQTGWQQEEKTTLPVGVVYARVMEVQPELVGPPLSANGLERIKLRLRYEDQPNRVTSDKELLFSAPGKGEPWKIQLADPGARVYSYELVYVLDTGFQRKVGPLASRDNFLVLSTVPPP